MKFNLTKDSTGVEFDTLLFFLIHLMPLVSFYTPKNTRKPLVF